MKKGDIIQCHDQKDLRETMRDLSAAGFNAVKDSGDNFDIRITGVPETQYLVKRLAVQWEEIDPETGAVIGGNYD